MRFYQCSTVRHGQQAQQSVHANEPTLHSNFTLPFRGYSSTFHNSFSMHYTELSSIFNNLSKELIQNNRLIALSISSQGNMPSDASQEKKDSQDNSTASRKNASQSNYERMALVPPQPEISHQPPPKRKQNNCTSESEESYHPDQECSKEGSGPKVNQSKNIPKNYGKAIITFIRKNEAYTRKVLDYLDMDFTSFMRNLRSIRKKLNTIAQLRSIWTNQQNEFARAYRIISIEYLRKHSLSYIFNSRVENHGKHIKYRYKIIESVSCPVAFTRMKEF